MRVFASFKWCALAALVLVSFGVRGDFADNFKFRAVNTGVGFSSPFVATESVAAGLARDFACSMDGNSGCSVGSYSGSYEGGDRRVQINFTTVGVGANFMNFNLQRGACVGGDSGPGGPCAPPDCSSVAGVTKTFSGSSGGIPASICQAGCAYEKDGVGVEMGGLWAMSFTASGQSCSGSTSATEAPPGEKCLTSGGLEYCHNPTGKKNCGFVNGEFVCLKQIKDGGCKVLADGSRVCGPNAGTPPVPDNGTPGVPAEPDEVLSATDSSGGTTTYNYYNNTTVSGSSRDPGDTGAPQGTGSNGGSGDGSGVADGEGEDDGSDVDTGDGSELGGFGSCMDANGGVSLSAMTACAGDAFGDAWEGLTSSPFLSAVSAIYGALGTGGSCPAADITIFDETYNLMDAGCTLLEEHAELLELLLVVGWSLLGVRIALST